MGSMKRIVACILLMLAAGCGGSKDCADPAEIARLQRMVEIRDEQIATLRAKTDSLAAARDESDDSSAALNERLMLCERELERRSALDAALAEAPSVVPPSTVAAPVTVPAARVVVPRLAPRRASQDVRNYSGPFTLPQGDAQLVQGSAHNFGPQPLAGELVVELYYDGSPVDSQSISFELAPGEDFPWQMLFDTQGEGFHEARAWIED